MDFLLDRPAIDYFTATSFDPNFYQQVQEKVLPAMQTEFALQEVQQHGQIMQYEGFHQLDAKGKKPVFLGEGEQKRQPHFIFRCSGLPSDFAYRRIIALNLQFNLSRVDLQLTIQPKRPVTPAKWKQFNQLQFNHEKKQGVRARNVALKTNNKTGNILTIGSRLSERYLRIYEKPFDQESDLNLNRVHLNRVQAKGAKGRVQTKGKKSGFNGQENNSPVRLEAELKGSVARSFHDQCSEQGLDLAMHAVLQSTIAHVVPTTLLSSHRTMIKQFPQAEAWAEGKVATLPHSTLRWFELACIGSAPGLLKNRVTRENFVELVLSLLEKTVPFMHQAEKDRAKQLLEH